jgi:hypothetical protein
MACKMCNDQQDRFTCKHNPSTVLGNHLLKACEGFQESAHWRHPYVIKKLASMASKVLSCCLQQPSPFDGQELMKDLVLSRYFSCPIVPLCYVCKHPCHHEPCRSAVTNPLATKLTAGMQEHHSEASLATGDMLSKESVRTGHELLMRWCTATATAPNAIAHPLFDAYVLHVSGQRHKASTRLFLMLALDRLAERIRSHIVQKTLKSTYVGLQLDSWSSGGRHLTALCTSVPGEQFFASAYENWREDMAANSAVAVNACTQQLLGLAYWQCS